MADRAQAAVSATCDRAMTWRIPTFTCFGQSVGSGMLGAREFCWLCSRDEVKLLPVAHLRVAFV